MTLEQKIAKFKNGIIVLHTPTENIYDMLMQKLENMGVKWSGDTEPTTGTQWLHYGELTCVNFRADHMFFGHCFDYNGRTVIDVKEDDFIVEPSSVTIISPSGEEKHIRGTVTKKDNDYVIKEVLTPKFSVGEEFVSKEGILGKVLGFSTKGEYYYRWITLYNVHSMSLEQFEGIMSKVEW